MQPFTTVSGTAIPFPRRNVDTDLIIPAAYLKAVSRSGMGKGAFAALRYRDDGSLDMDCVFNQPAYAGAPILLTGDNFGCGSSREHAAWALDDLGVRCVIAPSFADIFNSNAFKNGLVAITLPQEQVDALMAAAEHGPITVDLENQVVTSVQQHRFSFDYDPFKKHCLLNGLDEIGLTLQQEGAIASFETKRRAEKPWLFGKAGVAA
jgi:3-isopropylmalate/(R)-2-methylmalate dehydratase small subunit